VAITTILVGLDLSGPADIALERARLSDDRGMRERLRVFFDGEER